MAILGIFPCTSAKKTIIINHNLTRIAKNEEMDKDEKLDKCVWQTMFDFYYT